MTEKETEGRDNYIKICYVIIIIVILIIACGFSQAISKQYEITSYPDRLEGEIKVLQHNQTRKIEVRNKYNLEIKIKLLDKGGWSNYDPSDAILPRVYIIDENGEDATEKSYDLRPKHFKTYFIQLYERYENYSNFNNADLTLHFGIFTPYDDKVDEKSTTIKLSQ